MLLKSFFGCPLFQDKRWKNFISFYSWSLNIATDTTKHQYVFVQLIFIELGKIKNCSNLKKILKFFFLFFQESMCQYVNLTRNENQILVMQLYNLIGFFWSSWFASAICDITLAGAFASYYWAFNKSKDVPPFPILLAFRRAIR